MQDYYNLNVRHAPVYAFFQAMHYSTLFFFTLFFLKPLTGELLYAMRLFLST